MTLSGRPTTIVGHSNTSFTDSREVEQDDLTAVRQYAQRKLKLDETLAAIVAYDTLLADRIEQTQRAARHRLYRETVKAQPGGSIVLGWKTPMHARLMTYTR